MTTKKKIECGVSCVGTDTSYANRGFATSTSTISATTCFWTSITSLFSAGASTPARGHRRFFETTRGGVASRRHGAGVGQRERRSAGPKSRGLTARQE